MRAGAGGLDRGVERQQVGLPGDRLYQLDHVADLSGILGQSADEADRPVLDLTWDYPVINDRGEPNAEAVLAEINGWNADGEPLSSYEQLEDDGSTACGCWIYCGIYADGVNQAARRKHPEETLRSAQGILRLAKDFSPQRLETACEHALALKSYSYRAVRTLIEAPGGASSQPALDLLHENLRGPKYFQ